MIRKYFDKISKILVVIGMILSMCFSAGNISVNAWDYRSSLWCNQIAFKTIN